MENSSAGLVHSSDQKKKKNPRWFIGFELPIIYKWEVEHGSFMKP